MSSTDPRVDAYIAKSADFAQPILSHIREVVHEGCPEVEETIKWGMPSFMYKGILCGMACFKAHCTFGFWKGELITGENGESTSDAMGQFGRITSIKDLPPKRVLIGYVKKAMELNEKGVKSPTRSNQKPRPPIKPPTYFTAALRKNPKAQATFKSLRPSHRREYLEWITDAKTEPTRDRRLATTIEWLSEGKSLNWKYERKR
jgi:uncharacterized protein YdeI (YjbR/CyaY-like superfamily)